MWLFGSWQAVQRKDWLQDTFQVDEPSISTICNLASSAAGFWARLAPPISAQASKDGKQHFTPFLKLKCFSKTKLIHVD